MDELSSGRDYRYDVWHCLPVLCLNELQPICKFQEAATTITQTTWPTIPEAHDLPVTFPPPSRGRAHTAHHRNIPPRRPVSAKASDWLIWLAPWQETQFWTTLFGWAFPLMKAEAKGVTWYIDGLRCVINGSTECNFNKWPEAGSSVTWEGGQGQSVTLEHACTYYMHVHVHCPLYVHCMYVRMYVCMYVCMYVKHA